MRAILLPAPRHDKSSRGTPRLRRLPRTLHGALRLAAWTTRLGSWPRLLVCAQVVQPGLTFSLTHPGADLLARSAPLHPLAASGGFIMRLDWPALTPALTEIRLFVPFAGFGVWSLHTGQNRNSRLRRLGNKHRGFIDGEHSAWYVKDVFNASVSTGERDCGV